MVRGGRHVGIEMNPDRNRCFLMIGLIQDAPRCKACREAGPAAGGNGRHIPDEIQFVVCRALRVTDALLYSFPPPFPLIAGRFMTNIPLSPLPPVPAMAGLPPFAVLPQMAQQQPAPQPIEFRLAGDPADTKGWIIRAKVLNRPGLRDLAAASGRRALLLDPARAPPGPSGRSPCPIAAGMARRCTRSAAPWRSIPPSPTPCSG